MSAVQLANFSWPRALTPEPYLALQTYQVQKVAAVGLACILLLGFQLSCSWTIVAGVTFLCSVTTLFSEALLRRSDIAALDWMNTDFNKRDLMVYVALRLAILPIAVSLVTAFGFLPAQAVATQIINGNLRIILLTTLVAPIAEEIIFRGFLQERLEDLALLIDRYAYSLSEETKKRFSIATQAIIFGALHITGTQIVKKSWKIITCLQLSLFGASLALFKEKDESLLTPIAVHAAQNTGVTLGLLLSKLFAKS